MREIDEKERKKDPIKWFEDNKMRLLKRYSELPMSTYYRIITKTMKKDKGGSTERTLGMIDDIHWAIMKEAEMQKDNILFHDDKYDVATPKGRSK